MTMTQDVSTGPGTSAEWLRLCHIYRVTESHSWYLYSLYMLLFLLISPPYYVWGVETMANARQSKRSRKSLGTWHCDRTQDIRENDSPKQIGLKLSGLCVCLLCFTWLFVSLSRTCNWIKSNLSLCLLLVTCFKPCAECARWDTEHL